MTTPDQDCALLDQTAERLGEHFDSVLLLACRHESAEADGTVYLASSCGNTFAQIGMARHWLIVQDEHSRLWSRKKQT